MTDTTLLREAIHDATRETVRAPNLTQLIRRGRRRFALRAGVATVAMLGLVTAGGMIAFGLHDDLSTTDQFVAGSPDVTFISPPDRVHIGGQTVTAQHVGGHAEHAGSLHMSAPTSAGLVYVGRDQVPYLIDNDGHERALAASMNPNGVSDAGLSIVGSPDGRYAAWETLVDGDLVVNLFDAETGQVSESPVIDCATVLSNGAECDVLNAVADGVVYMSTRTATVAWDPSLAESEQVYRVTDKATEIIAVASKTVMLRGNGQVYNSTGEPLDDAWTIVRVGSMVEPVLTGNGHWRFTYAGAEESSAENTVSAVNVETGKRVELLPDALRVQSAGDNRVIVMTGTSTAKPQSIFTCELPSGECTEVTSGPHGSIDLAGGDTG